MRYEQSQSYPPLRNYISTVVKINVSHLNWFLVASSGVTHRSGWVSLLACLSRDHQTRTIYCKLKVASPSCSTLVTNSNSHSLKLLFHPATELISLCLSHPGPVPPPTLILVTVTHHCLRCISDQETLSLTAQHQQWCYQCPDHCTCASSVLQHLTWDHSTSVLCPCVISRCGRRERSRLIQNIIQTCLPTNTTH